MKSIALAAFVVVGCREATSAVACDPLITGSDSPILEVKFRPQAHIRVCSVAALPIGLQATLRHSGVVKVQPMFSAAAAQSADDLLSWHFMALTPGADTAAVLTTLRARPEIQYAYVHSEVIPPPPSR